MERLKKILSMHFRQVVNAILIIVVLFPTTSLQANPINPNQEKHKKANILARKTLSLTPPEDCNSVNVQIVNPFNALETLEAKFCESNEPGIGDLWLHSNTTVAHVVSVIPEAGVSNLSHKQFVSWGPDYWFLIQENVHIQSGQNIRIKASRFGETDNLHSAMASAHLTLISEILYTGDTPPPDMTRAEALYRYIQLVPGGDVAAIFSDCFESFFNGSKLDFLSCAISLGNNDQGVSFIVGGLEKLGVIVGTEIVEGLLTAIEFSINLYRVFGYVIEASDYLQDVNIVVYYPSDPTTPPPPSSCLTCLDNSAFIADITYPDGSVVASGASLEKIWRIGNTGDTAWGGGYQLVFLSGNQLGGPNAVNVPATAPGNTVDISVNMVAPNTPGTYTGNWRLRNAQGTYFGPNIPVRITVPGGSAPPPANAIELSCPDCLTIVPPGHIFRPTIRAQVNSGQLLGSRGDMLRNTDGNLFGAWPHVSVSGVVNTGQSYDFVFYAANPIQAPNTPGTYETKWRAWQNGQWAGPEYTIQFQVQEGGGVNRPPNPPTLTGPGDWAVYTGNTGIVLSAQHNGDPDGDPVTHYYFEIFESAQNANSGWITSNSWSPQGLGFNGYQWRVKVRDSRGAESGWSPQVWHFNVLNNQTQIYSFYSTTCQPTWGSPEQICFCAQTNAGTLRLQVNSATDGSANGEWQVLNELGTPNYNCASPDDRPPTWTQLEYEAGTHLVRLYARGEGGWENAAYQDITIPLPADRRPNTPPRLSPLQDAHVASRTVQFAWEETLRTTQYHLIVSTNEDFSGAHLIDVQLPVGTTTYSHTFAQEYATLYWRVTAIGPYGTNDLTSRFHIDTTPPTSTMSPLPVVTFDNNFTVNWSGSDARAGLRWYHVQVREGDRPDSQWTDWLVNTTKTAEIFRGSTGQTYYFRVRAMDNVGNWEAWPSGNGDTFTLIDPTAAPPTVWWNDNYAVKRNIVILNNDSDSMPPGYSVGVRYDGTTTPTSSEIYNASLAANKGDDVRIIYNNETELHRYVTYFSPTRIEIWFPLQGYIAGGQTSSGIYQIYYSNPSPGSPPADVNTVFLPAADGNTTGLWHFYEGIGSVAHDTSGNNRNGTFYNAGWGDGYLGQAGYFNGSNAYVEIAHTDAFYPGAITMEAWVYLTGSTGQYPMIFNKDRYWLRIHGDRNVQMLIKADGGDRSITSQTQLELNQWYHVAATFDGSQRMRLYINGQLDGESNNGAPPTLWNNHPLRIGRTENTGGSYFPGYIQHARISNIERTDFSYGRVNIAPTVATGTLIEPPVVGTADLAVLELRTYPSTSGGLLIQAVVENQGSISTRNGFSTDLHVDHLPIGVGDYTGSIQFWINDPIQAGTRITLTTVLETLPEQVAMQASNAGQITEFSGILYAQADSTGVISEPDTQNNIYADGADFCLATSDPYEGNDSWQDAGQLILNRAQTHNFYRPGDEDWFVIQVEAGKTYQVQTFNLGAGADTYLYLYDSDGETFLDGNDDYNNSLASFIEWTASVSGQYYLRVKHWNPNVAGCGSRYSIMFGRFYTFLPVMTGGGGNSSPPPTATPTSTPIVTNTPTSTPTSTPTATPVPDPPAAPNNVQATALDHERIEVTWVDNASNEDGFRIHNGVSQVGTVGPNVTSYIVTGLPPQTYYCHQVQAFNSAGSSSWSDWACTVTLPAPPFGDGSDGSLAVYATEYTDGVRTRLNNNASAGTDSLQVVNSSGFSPGDEVIIIQMFNSSGDAGQYEFNHLAEAGGGVLLLEEPLQNNYSQGGSAGAQVIRVPNYTDVTVYNGGILRAHSWDGNTGGIVAFRANGTVNVMGGGIIEVSGLGFAGGPGGNEFPGSYPDTGSTGGSYISSSPLGGPTGGDCGGCISPAGPANGGGGFGGRGQRGTDGASGGGGGSYGGNGASGIAAPVSPYAPGGQHGATYGGNLTNSIFLGSGGGGGGKGKDGYGAPGGNGGGAVIVYANELLLSGSIRANGSNGYSDANGNGGGGGGGTGGSIYLHLGSAPQGTNNLSVSGGNGGNGVSHHNGSNGGNGGSGRTGVDYYSAHFSAQETSSNHPLALPMVMAIGVGILPFALVGKPVSKVGKRQYPKV